MERYRILVVGCGSIGLRHISNLARRTDVEIAATDMNPKAPVEVSAAAPGTRFFATLDEAWAWNPLLTIVCTPNAAHPAVTLAAFEAGAHVLCEKPIADTVADGQRMVEASHRHNKVLAIGYSERFRPAVRFLEDKAAEGFFGNLIGARAMVGTYNTLLCAKSDFRSHVFGILAVDYTHELDILGAIFGRVASVQASANSLARKEIPATPSLIAMLLQYESGAVASVHMDYVQHPQRRKMEIIGDKRVVEYDLQTEQVTIFDAAREGYEVRFFSCDRNGLFVQEHQNVLDAILSGTPPRVSGEAAVRALETAEAAIAQLQTASLQR